MSQKKNRRFRARANSNPQVRSIAKRTNQWEYVLCDHYTRFEVKILNLVCLHQLVNRGMAELVKGRIARLKPKYKLESAELHPNGQPKIVALPIEERWEQGSSSATEAVCRALWLLTKAPQWGVTLRFTIAHKEAAEAARVEAIVDETQSWGLPAAKPVRIAASWD